MTFQEAQQKLLAYVQDRIHNGELTERGFARRLGLSQPHVHNVLKGVRNLSPEVFDLILGYFRLSILDLAEEQDLQSNLKKRRLIGGVAEVSLMGSPVGPGLPWPSIVNWRKSLPIPVPTPATEFELVMVHLSPDEDMQATLGDFDIALLDTSDEARSDISPEWLYVIARDEDTVLRRLRPGASGYYLLSDRAHDNPIQWERINLPASRFVRARVLWVGRARDHAIPLI